MSQFRNILSSIDMENQSIEIPNSGGIRKSAIEPLGGETFPYFDDAKTILEALNRGKRLSDDGPCLGWRGTNKEFSWLSYSEVLERSNNFASGLIKLGMKPGQSSFVGIYMQNSVEWTLTEMATYYQSAINVPLYDTLGLEARNCILNQTELNIVVCAKEEQVISLLQEKAQTPHLKDIIVVNAVSKDTEQKAKEIDVLLHYYKDIEELGKKNPAPIKASEPSDIATICYTSGTTGQPKGAMLTHKNALSSAANIMIHYENLNINHEERILSFLPLAHILERNSELLIFLAGARVGYYSGDMKLLLDDIKALKPTLMPVVPRLLYKIYDKIQTQIRSSIIKRIVMAIALNRKMSQLKNYIIRKDTIWDYLVFNRVQEILGGNVKILASGGAPISEEVITFFRCAMGCAVIEGYGLTETCSAATLTLIGDYTPGHIGIPVPTVQIKLVDVPDLNYFSKDGKGEICIKGNSIFKGYYKNPEQTAEVLDEDGWFHSGDIGMWLPNGTLKIIDRKKNIFKLSQGEYIIPDKIENIYVCSTFVTQIFVYGDSLKSWLVAIIVPDKEVVLKWCKVNNIRGSWDEICQNEVLKEEILNDIISLGKKAGLNSFEQVKDIHLHPKEFTVEENLVTPTFKLKRPMCSNYFKNAIDLMYKNLN